MTVTNITDRRAKHQDAVDRLDAMVERLTDTETFRAYLAAMGKFHRYSWSNTALILLQRPDARHVNSYRRWLDLGRQVRQGQKAVYIFAPMTRKNEDGVSELSGFRLVPVFDIAQTEGDELPDAPRPEPIDGFSLRTEAAADVVLDLIAARGAQVIREDTSPALGYWKPRKRIIAVDTSLSGNMALSVLVHETAHMLADHHGNIAKGDAESVAEATAFVVMSYLDVDTSRFSVPYLAGWAHDPAVLRRNLAEVQRHAHTIIEAIEDAMTDEPDLADAA